MSEWNEAIQSMQADTTARTAVEGEHRAPIYTWPDTAQEHPPAANENAPVRERLGTFMQTFTGRAVFPLDLRPDDIDVRDIAHSLSMQCRFAGHVRAFYSVAEHSVHVARWCRQFGADAALEGLLHDATEAYLVDIPRPVKPFLQGYKEAEARAARVIYERYDLRGDYAVVHEADNRVLNDERAALMAPCEREWDLADTLPLGVTIEGWSPARAEREFLALFDELYGED